MKRPRSLSSYHLLITKADRLLAEADVRIARNERLLRHIAGRVG